MDLWDVYLFEFGKHLSKWNLAISAFFEYKSCINVPKPDEYFHWYLVILFFKSLIFYKGLTKIKSIYIKWFVGVGLTVLGLVYSYLKPSISQVGYKYNSWFFVLMCLLFYYLVLNRVTISEFIYVAAMSITTIFAETYLTGIQFALDCFFLLLSALLLYEKLSSKLTVFPYTLFLLYTFYVDNFCLTFWGFGMLVNGIVLCMAFVYMTRDMGNRFTYIMPIVLSSAAMYVYARDYGNPCLQKAKNVTIQRSRATP